MTVLPNIVLVHGAWADGSSWSAVIEHLQADGYHVTAPQLSLTNLADDVARVRQLLARQNGPTVVAGHQVIPPPAQGQFAARMAATTVEVSTNHVAMVSHPDAVLALIRTAIEAAPAPT